MMKPQRPPRPRRPWLDFLELIGRGLFVAVPTIAGALYFDSAAGAIAGAVSGAVLAAVVEIEWPGPLTRRQEAETAFLDALLAWTMSYEGARDRRKKDNTQRQYDRGNRDY